MKKLILITVAPLEITSGSGVKNDTSPLAHLTDNPVYYAEILEKNKGNLKTTAPYKKSKRAVDELLGRNQNTKKKIDLAIEYLLNKCEDITPLALQKALSTAHFPY